MLSSHTALLRGINPALPASLKPLLDLAYDFHWSFCPAAQAVFERIDPVLWRASGNSPIRVLSDVSRERLAELVTDKPFLAALADATRRQLEHHTRPAWFDTQAAALPTTVGPFLAAYFCAEFGIHESFQIYSGGLGLLAGDHLKSAAELALPLVGVGLLYRNGYFHQKLDASGVQVEQFPPLDAVHQPVTRVMDLDSGRQVTVGVHLPGRDVRCAVWRADVGRTRLYLLDTNIPENAPEDREITANLYLGDHNRRIQQELVLGIGGVRALTAVGEHPTVYHMNEGHAAFLALERIRLIREHTGLTFDQAREAASPAHVFTTHTPVPAGIDHFATALMQHYFAGYHDQLGLDMEGFLALGRQSVEDKDEDFSMAILALRCSKFANGVSRLHGEVSRSMWQPIWPSTPIDDVPIGHVTNGVHVNTWIDPGVAALLDKHTASDWRLRPHEAASWAGIDRVSDAELWAVRSAARARFIETCARWSDENKTGGVKCTLDPKALTIGFARRFAGYKRATLLFRDPDRFAKLLNSADRPVQFVIAGKSHPGDGWGKDLIRQVVEFTRSAKANARIIFVEDYAIDVAREMVRGCDVWLNTPIRGLEASGTSGMKAALNGVLHASILDGWWDEGYQPDAGYRIPDSGIYPTDAPDEARESAESDALYQLIEKHIIPDFYTRDSSNIPTRWTARMRACIRSLAPFFNTHRMVAQYATDFYFPAHTAASRLAAKDMAAAKDVADHIDRYRRLWHQVRIKNVEVLQSADGASLSVIAAVRLGLLRPDEVQVQVYQSAHSTPGAAHTKPMVMACKAPLAGGDGTYQYSVKLPFSIDDAAAAGNFQARVLPADERLVSPFIPGLIATSPVTPIRVGEGAGA